MIYNFMRKLFKNIKIILTYICNSHTTEAMFRLIKNDETVLGSIV